MHVHKNINTGKAGNTSSRDNIDHGDNKKLSKYAESLKVAHFFAAGFLNPISYNHGHCRYQSGVDADYFEEVVWQNVGSYLRQGMNDLENEQEQTRGTKAAFLKG